MSGETEQQVSGWTVDTLHTHLLRLIGEGDRRYEQRFIAQQSESAAALLAARDAMTKAENASEKRFEGVNEFRAALQDAAARNMTRGEFEAAHSSLVELVADLKSRFERYEARTVGTTAGVEATHRQANSIRTLIVASAGVVVAAISVAVALILATR